MNRRIGIWMVALLVGELAAAQEARFQITGDSVKNQLEIKLEDKSHEVDLSQTLYRDSFVLSEFVFEQDDRSYAILNIGFPSKPSSNGNGFCGAGYEEVVVLVSFDLDLSNVEHQSFYGASCLRGIYPDILQDGDNRSTLEDLTPDFETITIEIQTDDEGWKHTLNRKELAAGFIRSELE